SDGVVVFGEVGLGGEIRTVSQAERRIAEAKKLGFTNALAPKNSSKDSFVTAVRDLREALIKYLQ
ncbi:MAG: DNA repair protein RadA, partial [Candidatus Nanogingivalaceae bacterium]|nr:DNA repair protein RadA [Candidatus Nanogingivalaceae bacterium]